MRGCVQIIPDTAYAQQEGRGRSFTSRILHVDFASLKVSGGHFCEPTCTWYTVEKENSTILYFLNYGEMPSNVYQIINYVSCGERLICAFIVLFLFCVYFCILCLIFFTVPLVRS